MPHRSFNNPDSLEARQHLLDQRCLRNHSKRHRTQKRASKKRAAAKQRAAHVAAIRAAKYGRFLAAVNAYWRGEIEEHP